MEDIPEWFQGARLNFAENLLRFNDDKVALYTAGTVQPYLFILILITFEVTSLKVMNFFTFL